MTKLPDTLEKAKALAHKVKAYSNYLYLIDACETIEDLIHKSSGDDWAHLLRAQPQLAKHRVN